MASKFSTPVKALNSRAAALPANFAANFAAGGAKNSAKKSGSTSARGISWAVLAGDSDSDCDVAPAAPAAPRKAPLAAAPFSVLLSFDSDPIMAAMNRGDVLWGDLMCDDEPSAPATPVAASASAPAEVRETADQRAKRESDIWLAHCDDEEALLWRQPFAENLEMYWSDYYDTRTMSEEHYNEFMSWIYARGWFMDCEPNRAGCKAVPDNEGESRIWVPPSRFSAMAGSGCSKAHGKPAPMAAPGTDAGRRKGAPVPRFCRAATACEDEGCRYVHGDTIPRVNKPCGFGAACGASDPTGAKRSQCLFMHPGETWTEGLTIQRLPIPAA